jgi:transposase
MSAYWLDLTEKIVESVKRDVPKAETAHRFGVDRATVKRYCKQLHERGTLESRKAPGNKPKLDEQARRLLVEDLRQRPWATHSQRADEMGTHTSLAPVYAYSPRRRAGGLRTVV